MPQHFKHVSGCGSNFACHGAPFAASPSRVPRFRLKSEANMNRGRMLLLALAAIAPSAVSAAPPPEQFLPNTTAAAIMTNDGAGFVKAWEKTQFSPLAGQPLLQP